MENEHPIYTLFYNLSVICLLNSSHAIFDDLILLLGYLFYSLLFFQFHSLLCGAQFPSDLFLGLIILAIFNLFVTDFGVTAALLLASFRRVVLCTIHDASDRA